MQKSTNCIFIIRHLTLIMRYVSIRFLTQATTPSKVKRFIQRFKHIRMNTIRIWKVARVKAARMRRKETRVRSWLRIRRPQYPIKNKSVNKMKTRTEKCLSELHLRERTNNNLQQKQKSVLSNRIIKWRQKLTTSNSTNRNHPQSLQPSKITTQAINQLKISSRYLPKSW